MRTTLSALALAAVVTAATAVPAAAQTKWDLPSAYPPANFHTQNLNQFAADVKAMTGGKLEITVHSNASLFKAPEIKRAVQTGQVQAGEVLISLHENEDPLFGLDVVPFLATSYQESWKLYQVSRPAIEKKLASQGLQLLYAVAWPPQGIFAKKDINSVEDLRGTRWRAYNAGTSRIAEIAGAQPVTVQAADLAQALATGVVNTFITSSATGVDSKVWESMTHYYDTQAWLPKNVIFVNKAAFDRLDAATKEGLLRAASTAEERGWKLSQETTRKNMEIMAQNGMKVLQPSPALADGLRQIGSRLTADWLQRAGASGHELINAYKSK
ncbi:TRAP transporter substrate-binding protein [Arenibaculum pallidiluteum]|uniref:TRAP transporter substrate-binding protein n=1 Tax=Arenibaculum pallidiluteum TaxID=2812559 RepID=UPI001A964E8E|nr:TRAP transporter substrate-binding protein [Arenibaculum pallidiluteum]